MCVFYTKIGVTGVTDVTLALGAVWRAIVRRNRGVTCDVTDRQEALRESYVAAGLDLFLGGALLLLRNQSLVLTKEQA